VNGYGTLRNVGLKPKQNKKVSQSTERRLILAEHRAIVSNLSYLPGSRILDQILGHKDPRKFVQALPYEDFFWLVKKVGEDDSLPLLELASVEQWQYLFDLEIWKKDRLDVAYTSLWMNRLQQADCIRLVKWLLSEGESIAFYHFYKSIEVIEINSEDEVYDIPEGFFSLDGVFFIRVIDSQYWESIEHILRVMAEEDFIRYQALLLGLAGVSPAETEEGMYRMRNVRLAEHGFLPFEEAMSIYAPLIPEALKTEKQQELLDILDDTEIMDMVPVTPLSHVGAENMLTDAIGRINDPIFLDRIRLEFAGLCNQILSADGLMDHELDVLIRTCHRAGRYLNLAIERLCGRDRVAAERLLRDHSLVSLFRVGFGLALKVKWEAERWLQGSWFHDQGLDTDFWGEHWGGILAGLLEKKPTFYVGPQEEEYYKDFEWLSELGESLKVLRCSMVLDSLIENLTEKYQIDKGILNSSDITFYPLLFNLWGRILLQMKPCFSEISIEQAKSLFHRLRAGSTKPPYRMTGFQETFVEDFMAYASDADSESASILRDTLSLIWQDFQEEYEGVSLSDLDGRYSSFIMISN
jgi:hypothetical protein